MPSRPDLRSHVATPVRLPRPPLAPVTDLETLEPTVTLDAVLLLLGGAALGGILAAFILPALLPDLAASLLGEQPKAYWYLSRASGVVAYLLLWLSCVLGLSLTNRLARLWAAGPAVADLHQFSSLLGLTLLVFHVVILLGDRYASYRVDQLLAPFTAIQHEPVWVGLGQLAAYILLPLTFSFYVRRQIGLRTWRMLHFSSFAVYWLSVAHGIGAGTDTGTGVMLGLYIVTAGSIVFLTCYRVLVVVAGRPATRADHLVR